MKRLTSITDLEKLQKDLALRRKGENLLVTLCQGTGCKAYESHKIYEAFEKELNARNLREKVSLRSTGCHGFCEQGPLAVIFPGEICYCRVKAEDIPEIVEKTLIKGETVERLLFQDPEGGKRYAREEDIPFYRHQERLLLGQNRLLDPRSIKDYIALGGYQALGKVLAEMTPSEVVEEVKKSNLRGRGGAGFPTGIKWETTRQAPGEEKYVVVNADEGDPGAYMDRSLLEGNPHLVLEGLIIGAYAMGAKKGFIFLRQEYPLALENLRLALKEARDYGLLGENILGTSFSFEAVTKRGAGAFVTGESSALVAAIEGRVGEPGPKHINTALQGIGGKPTALNNVETWANIPRILERGASWYASLGNRENTGTKIFSLVGKVNNTGLIEVPLGTTLKTIIFDIGGGIKGGKKFKAVQTGGPSGGCLPEKYLDLPVDFDRLRELGSMMGSGGMIVMDEDSCMVDVARYFMQFLKEESCGKCISCREGINMMYDILEGIALGKGREEELELLEELAWATHKASLCGLGKTAANPVTSTLKYFRQEYLAHLKEKRCPAGVCKALISYTLDQEKCNGCGRCQKLCPVKALEGERGSPPHLNHPLCIKCGICFEACPFKAIYVQ